MDNPVMKSGKLLAEFVMYCAAHPDLRFYQALSGWSGYKLLATKECPVFQDQIDTIAWETKDGKP
jgi:hypothetical protein